MELTGSEELDVEHLARLVGPRTRLVSLVHVSNMLGCMLPVHKVAEICAGVGAKLLLDCCQSGAAGKGGDGAGRCGVPPMLMQASANHHLKLQLRLPSPPAALN